MHRSRMWDDVTQIHSNPYCKHHQRAASRCIMERGNLDSDMVLKQRTDGCSYHQTKEYDKHMCISSCPYSNSMSSFRTFCTKLEMFLPISMKVMSNSGRIIIENCYGTRLLLMVTKWILKGYIQAWCLSLIQAEKALTILQLWKKLVRLFFPLYWAK